MMTETVLDAILDDIEEDDDYAKVNSALATAILAAIGNDDAKWTMVDDAISAYTFALVDKGVWDSNDLSDADEQSMAALRDLTGEKWTMIHDAVSAYAHVVMGKGVEVGNDLREADKWSIAVLHELSDKESIS